MADDAVSDNRTEEQSHLLTVPETAKLLRISRNLAYELVARHEIPAIRLGRSIRVPRAELEAWLANNAAHRAGPALGIRLDSRTSH